MSTTLGRPGTAAEERLPVLHDQPCRIKAPLREPREVTPLLAAGADHFYAGLALPAAASHPLTVADRRGCVQHNVLSLSEYRNLADEVGRQGSRLYLTLNAQHIPEDAYGGIRSVLDQLCGSGGFGGVIVSNLRLIREVTERHPALTIVGSIVLNVFNIHTLDLYIGMGIRSFVLDRSLRVEEIAALARHAPEVEWAAILFHDYCGNIDGACHVLHDSQLGDDLRTACMGTFIRFHPNGAPSVRPSEEVTIRGRFDSAYPVRDAGCGACLVRRFHRAGVRCLKVAGRIHSLEMKLEGVRQAAAALRCLSTARDEEEFRRQTRSAVEGVQGRPCRERDCLLPFY